MKTTTRPARRPVPTQDELRARRRNRLPITYTGTFDLAAEVRAICTPLAQRVSTTANPAQFAPDVDDVVLAVAGVVRTIAAMLADSDARRRTATVPVENRDRARRALVLVADRPADPEIDAEAVESGQWAAILAEHSSPFAGPLADLLGRAIPPGQTRGAVSISETVETELREIDSVAVNLTRHLDRAESRRGQDHRAAQASTDTDQARATLAELGITV